MIEPLALTPPWKSSPTVGKRRASARESRTFQKVSGFQASASLGEKAEAARSG